MLKLKNGFYLLCIVVLSSCASTLSNKITFTKDVRSVLESDNIDLSKIQYYIDGDVTLTRELASDTTKVSNGEVVFENGKYYNAIYLKKNTPGVCTAIYPNRLQISFDENNNRNLTFSPTSTSAYQIINNSTLNRSSIIYDGLPYTLKYAGIPPVLVIKKSSLSKNSNNSRIMKGRKV